MQKQVWKTVSEQHLNSGIVSIRTDFIFLYLCMHCTKQVIHTVRVCVWVRVLLHVPCLHKHFGPLCFSSECLFQAEQNERHGQKAGGRAGERSCCIPISPAHWGRTVPKILGLRWSSPRPPISNSVTTVQCNSNNNNKWGKTGWIHAACCELLQYTARLQDIKAVKSGNVKGVECRLSWAKEDIYIIIQLSYQYNHGMRLQKRLERYLP